MATATASINSCSVSQWYSVTTPPCKKGTMAKPLPNTKAPALVKNQAICANVSGSNVQNPVPKSNREFETEGFLIHLGGAFTSMYIMPAITNKSISSLWVIMVMM